MLGAE